MEYRVTIDEGLLDEVRSALGTADAQETVDAALREVIRTRQLQEIARSIGTEDLVDMTVEELLESRAREVGRLGDNAAVLLPD
ncbi:MAG: type II toxin-antitoxin system VapB family antitoxin [Chloroflexota bacterium]